MNSNLIITSTKGMSHTDWLKFRKRGLGASEIGAVMGLSEYKSSMELFYEKIGDHINVQIENMAMFAGHEQENYIAKLWEYWAGSEQSMIANYRAGNRVRRMQKVNGYVQNPKYPYLFVSLDRKINKYTENGVERGEGALELKTIAGYEADKWVSGIPPQYLIQVQTQCLVCEFEYGELAILRDGRNFDVFPFERMPNICDAIVQETTIFWEKVEEGKKILTKRFEAERNFNYRAVEELTHELHSIEPDPDSSIGFEAFLKEKYKKSKHGEMQGNILHVEAAKKHRHAKETIKQLEIEAREQENYLKNEMRELDSINLGANGKVTWRTDVNGVRRFNNAYRE